MQENGKGGLGINCDQFGVIIDTHIVVFFVCYDPQYRDLIEIIRREDWIMLVCDGAEKEYIRQIAKRYASAIMLLNHFYSQLRQLNKLKREIQPNESALVRITDKKDQHHIDCAIKSNEKAWVIVTDNIEDFQWSGTNPIVPKIMTWVDFSNNTVRSNLLAEIRRICGSHHTYPVS